MAYEIKLPKWLSDTVPMPQLICVNLCFKTITGGNVPRSIFLMYPYYDFYLLLVYLLILLLLFFFLGGGETLNKGQCQLHLNNLIRALNIYIIHIDLAETYLENCGIFFFFIKIQSFCSKET